MQKLLMLSSALLCTLGAFAQADSLSSYWKNVQLEQVVVTGTRTPKYLKDTPIQTLVISNADILKVDATNVQDLLQQEMPGVEFSYAMNQQVHMNFSGFGGQGILFLVDGERMAGETMDDVDFTRLNMNNVERIEIVKGAASALYGSNATGGVINIITKDGGNPFSLNLNARYAPRHNEHRYGGVLGLNSKSWHNTLSVNYNSKENFDVKSASDPVTRVVTTIYGGRTVNVKEQLSWKPLSGLKITGRAGYFYRTLTRVADTPERYRDFNAGIRGTWEMSKNDNIELSYSFDQYDKSDFQKISRLDIRDYSNVQNIFRGIYSHAFNDNKIITVGADFMHDYLYNVNLENDRREQNVFDVFTQFDCNINKRWEIVGALRYDYFSSQGGSHVTPKISARCKALDNLTVRFGYGMGFRAPTLKEQYYNFDMVGIWIIEGNPNLRSELSHNLHASAEWTKNNYNITASAYYNNVENKLTTGIPFYKPDNDKQLYLNYINLEDYSVYGAEITAKANWSNGFTAKVSYAYTHEELPKNKDGNIINNQYIPARAHTLTARINWDRQLSRNYGINIGLNGKVLSNVTNKEFVDYYDISKGTNSVDYPAYSLWKLNIVQRFGKKMKLTCALDNILNYKPKYYYLNSPLTDGINLMVGAVMDL